MQGKIICVHQNNPTEITGINTLNRRKVKGITERDYRKKTNEDLTTDKIGVRTQIEINKQVNK